MTAPMGDSEFCFPQISMFPSTLSLETLRFEGKKFTAPSGPVIRELKKLLQQRQRQCQLKNEFIFYLRISGYS